MVLVSPPLTHTNYHTWSRSMMMSLLTKNKEGFIDGTIQEPSANSSIRPFWQHCNTMVLRWLVRSMSAEFAQSIIWRSKASEVWAELKRKDYHMQIFSKFDLSITKYYMSMKTLWDEPKILDPIPTCICNAKCTCDALMNLNKHRNTKTTVRFLRGLNEQYSTVRSQIMLIDPLPPINKVYSLVAKNSGNSKVLINVAGNSVQDTKSFNNFKASTNQKFQQQGGKICSHCGKSGHTIDVCYKKHGFPPSFKFKNPKYANRSANLSIIENIEDADIINTSRQEQKFGFIAKQYQTLLALLPQNSNDNDTNHIDTTQVNLSSVQQHSIILTHNGKILNTKWILDTGATDHIFFSLTCFTSYKFIKPIHVNLPNGNSILASISGTIHFSPFLYLTDNLNTSKMIGTAEAKDGLYLLKGPDKIQSSISMYKSVNSHCNSSFVDKNLWHFRLYTWVYLLKNKSEVRNLVQNFIFFSKLLISNSLLSRLIHLLPVSSSNQLVDILTKPLASSSFITSYPSWVC
uniref:Uncharacterized protein n=1 Tax=Cajanus cajan TaxID=3821 RepID=A0A151QTV4_CAJCA|nr:hypothetical protein KK1_045413 [Cajanus cajan]